MKRFLKHNFIFDSTLILQLILKFFQFLSLYIFAKILLPEELGLWAFFLVITGFFVVISGIGNNITLKSRLIDIEKKKQLIKASISISVFTAPLIFVYLINYFDFNLALSMCFCMIVEILRFQLSIFEISKGNLLRGTVYEVIPLISAILFSFFLQLVNGFSLESRVYGYTLGLFLSCFIFHKHIKEFKYSKINLSFLISSFSLLKYFYLLNIAVFLGIDKFFLKSINTEFLGLYSLNLSIISSLFFFTKFVENKIIAGNLNNSNKNLSTIIIAILSAILTLILPKIFHIIGLSNFILDSSSRFVLFLYPLIMNEIGIRQNIIYKSSILLKNPLIFISLSNLLTIAFIYVINPNEYTIIKIYLLNLILIMIIVGFFSNRSIILTTIKKTKYEFYNRTLRNRK